MPIDSINNPDSSQPPGASEELQRIEAELHATIREVVDLKAALDAHAIVAVTDPHGKITYVNDQFCEISKYSRNELLGKDHRVVNSGHHPREFMRCLWQTISSGKVWRGEICNKAKDGSLYWVYSTIVPFFDDRGNIRQYVAIRANITEQKMVEAEKARLESHNRRLQKSESLAIMAGAIAHNYNNMLMAVMGNLELALMGAPNDDRTACLQSAMQAARKTSELGNLMLTYLGYAPARREPLDLAEACRNFKQKAISPKNVHMEWHLPSPGLVILANPEHIAQILSALTTNAAESCGENSGCVEITVSVCSRQITQSGSLFPLDWQPESGSYACLEISDNGCGISPANLEKIFDPFFSTKFTGRGMGLPSALGMVRSHDGAISAASNEGQGSVFRVFFPISTTNDASPPSAG